MSATSFSRVLRAGLLALAEGQRPRTTQGRDLEARLRGVATTLRADLDRIRDDEWESASARKAAAARVIEAAQRKVKLLEGELTKLEQSWHGGEGKVADVVDQLEARVNPLRLRLLERHAARLEKMSTTDQQAALAEAVRTRNEDLLLAGRLAGVTGAKSFLEDYAVGPTAAEEARNLSSDWLAMRQAHDALTIGTNEMLQRPDEMLSAAAFASPEERLAVCAGGLSAFVEVASKLSANAFEAASKQAPIGDVSLNTTEVAG